MIEDKRECSLCSVNNICSTINICYQKKAPIQMFDVYKVFYKILGKIIKNW